MNGILDGTALLDQRSAEDGEDFTKELWPPGAASAKYFGAFPADTMRLDLDSWCGWIQLSASACGAGPFVCGRCLMPAAGGARLRYACQTNFTLELPSGGAMTMVVARGCGMGAALGSEAGAEPAEPSCSVCLRSAASVHNSIGEAP